MKTSVQAMFDRFVAFQDVYTKCASFLEAQCLVRGYRLVNSSVKAEDISIKTVVRTKKVRAVVKSRRPARKVKTFPRFVGRLVVAVNTTVDLTSQIREVKAQARANKVALSCYIKALEVAQKATAKVSEVKSKTVGWSVDLLKAMSKDAQAKVALEAAKAAL